MLELGFWCYFVVSYIIQDVQKIKIGEGYKGAPFPEEVISHHIVWRDRLQAIVISD